MWQDRVPARMQTSAKRSVHHDGYAIQRAEGERRGGDACGNRDGHSNECVTPAAHVVRDDQLAGGMRSRRLMIGTPLGLAPGSILKNISREPMLAR